MVHAVLYSIRSHAEVICCVCSFEVQVVLQPQASAFSLTYKVINTKEKNKIYIYPNEYLFCALLALKECEENHRNLNSLFYKHVKQVFLGSLCEDVLQQYHVQFWMFLDSSPTVRTVFFFSTFLLLTQPAAACITGLRQSATETDNLMHRRGNASQFLFSFIYLIHSSISCTFASGSTFLHIHWAAERRSETLTSTASPSPTEPDSH